MIIKKTILPVILFWFVWQGLWTCPYGRVLEAEAEKPAENRDGDRELEKRLPGTAGKNRLQLLTRLVTYFEDREPAKAIRYGKEALELMRTFPDPPLRIQVTISMSMAYMDQGKTETATHFVDHCMELAESSGNPDSQAAAFLAKGRLLWRKGNHQEAAGFLARSHSLYEKQNNRKGLARVKNLTGLMYWRVGDYPRAVKYLLDSHAIYERMGERTWTPRLLNNIAIIYYEFQEYEQSAHFFNKALAQYREQQDKAAISRVLNNLGLLLVQQEKYDNALEYFRRSLEIKKELGIKDGYGTSLGNIGNIYEKWKNFEKALEYYRKALEISTSLNQQVSRIQILTNLGRIHLKMDAADKARGYGEKALELADRYHNKKEKSMALDLLSKIYTQSGLHRKAMDYYKRYTKLNDSLHSTENKKTVNELRALYESQSKEEKIKLLERDRQIEKLALERERSLSYSLVFASVLILALAIWLYFRGKLGHRLNAELQKEADRHRQTMIKLRSNEEEYRQLAEKSILGLLIMRGTNIIYANPRILNVAGFSLQEFLERSPLEFIEKSDRKRVLERMVHRRKGLPTPRRFAFKIKTKDGETRYIESHTDDITYLGEPAVMSSLVDVTDRKKTEAELLKSRKLESIGILAGGIAHDFNNLLSIIVGYIEMLKEDFREDSPQYKRLLKMGTAAQQAADLCRNLSIFSKKAQLVFKKVELTVILRKVLEIYPELKSKLDETIIPEDLRSLCGDERHLTQVISNLLVNALEADKDEPTAPLSISLAAANINLDGDNKFGLEKRQYVRIIVADNGRGIEPAEQKKVFEPFYSTKAQDPSAITTGVGLGLPICYSIVHRHGGEITIVSQPGAGTAVTVLLPAYLEE